MRNEQTPSPLRAAPPTLVGHHVYAMLNARIDSPLDSGESHPWTAERTIMPSVQRCMDIRCIDGRIARASVGIRLLELSVLLTYLQGGLGSPFHRLEGPALKRIYSFARHQKAQGRWLPLLAAFGERHTRAVPDSLCSSELRKGALHVLYCTM